MSKIRNGWVWFKYILPDSYSSSLILWQSSFWQILSKCLNQNFSGSSLPIKSNGNLLLSSLSHILIFLLMHLPSNVHLWSSTCLMNMFALSVSSLPELFPLSIPLCLVSLYVLMSYPTFKYNFIVTFSNPPNRSYEFIATPCSWYLEILYKVHKFFNKYFLTDKYPWWVWLVYIRSSPVSDGSRWLHNSKIIVTL